MELPQRRRLVMRAAAALAVLAALLGAAPAAAEAQSTDAGYFSDDDGSVHEPALDALAARGVLAGIECGEGLICPSKPLKRWEMAVWLVRVLDGAEPAAVEAERFSDVDYDLWWAPFVERLFDMGITGGCRREPLRYCPDSSVTRAQMATFLTRAFEFEAAPSAGFTDGSDGSHSADIDALAAAGVTAGCSREPLRYCPADPVTRAQMATFLGRASGLIELPASVRFTAVDDGWRHTCGLRADGAVVCWGDNEHGQGEAPSGEFSAISVGADHSCGLRADGAVVCWGDNGLGQADTPTGTFTAVAAGDRHTCALRSDGTVSCWGYDSAGQADPPGDSFTSVSAGFRHSCGVRSDGAAVCWGDSAEGQADPPDGDFREVGAGNHHSCGLRSEDSTIVCWGSDSTRQLVAPSGPFKAVSLGWRHTCGLRADGTAVCWGRGRSGVTRTPSGEFTHVSASIGHDSVRACGVRVDGAAVCWGRADYGRPKPTEGAFEEVSAGDGHACAVRASGEVACWGSNSRQQAEAPDGELRAVAAGGTHSCGVGIDNAIVCWGKPDFGPFRAPEGEFGAVAAGRRHSCGLRLDEAVVCWGENGSGEADAPQGAFRALGLGSWHSCAVSTDGAVTCWGNNSNGQAAAPDGEFVSVAAGSWHSCGLRADGAVVCWGAGGEAQLRVPEGQFAAVASGDLHSCAIDVHRAVVCWGSNEHGQLDAPGGEFVAVAAERLHSCAVRADGTVACWGRAGYRAPPPGVQRFVRFDHPDPGSCRPHGPDGVTAGFPLPSWAASSLGTLRVAVLFVDFRDAPAGHSTRQEAGLGLPFAERYLEAVSYGRLDVEFDPFHGWLRAAHGVEHYLTERGWVGRALTAEAVQLTDPDIDFDSYDMMMVVTPSSHLSGGNSLGAVRTDDAYIPAVQVNIQPIGQPIEPWPWGRTAAHEMAHGLGLADLYAYDDSRFGGPDPPADRSWVYSTMGLMSLRVRFIADIEDPRFAYDVRFPDGFRFTDYQLSPHAFEMLAWSRWQLGWLDASQVVCIDDDQATVALSPVAAPDGGTAMAAVPLSGHGTLVIESRRKIGYDADLDQAFADGAAATLPTLVTEGVLVYTVDASLPTGELPLTVAGDSGDGSVGDYPVLTVGQSVTVRGYTISVVADDGDTHTVTITKD